ncbi:MAG: HAD-superfamily hydrolase, subfamily variant 3 [Ilumatobacteraceae bacterium]|nr:HAD-superfamily hydrolase, subfamily variant 3 [Ilumatobacteraceae bacterium]
MLLPHGDSTSRRGLPEALVFDLDGTVVDTETPEFEAIRSVWSAHGLEYTVEQFERIIGTASGAGAWIDELDRAIGSSVDRDAARTMHRAVHTRLTNELVPRDGIVQLVDDALAAGVPMAIASNSPRWWVLARIEAAGLVEAFATVVSVDESSVPKPHPAPYLEACAALGANPKWSVAFEDSAIGVRSAMAAGLYTVACAGPLTRGHDLSAASRVITAHTDVTLAELGRALRG